MYASYLIMGNKYTERKMDELACLFHYKHAPAPILSSNYHGEIT